MLVHLKTLNIFELNFVSSSEKLNSYSFSGKDSLPRKGMFIRILIYFYHLINEFFKINSSVKFANYKNKPLLIAVSKNQHDALYPIYKKMKGALFLGLNGFGEKIFSLKKAYLISLLFVFKLFNEYKNANDFQKYSFKFALNEYLLSYGYYIQCYLLLKKTKPNMVIVANDHLLPTRGLIKAATDLNIITIYLQHASVSENFPPLNFTYAFLDGYDALNKYNSIEGKSDTKVFLTGFAKFDGMNNFINKSAKVKYIGVCVSTIDNYVDIKLLIKNLSQDFKHLKIILRPHPGDKRNIKKIVENENNNKLIFSDSDKEDSFVFLKKVDSIISGESNILLEAALLNVYPIFYEISKYQIHDCYGFIRNRLVNKYYENYVDLQKLLLSLLKNKPSVRNKAKYYYNTINTQYDGHSSDLIKELLSEIIDEGRVDLKNWKKIKDVKLTAYQLID